MKAEEVNVKFLVYWRFKDYPHLKVTRCKKIINCKTNSLLKYHTRGFFIGNRYIKRSELNKHIEKIPNIEPLPF